MGKTKKGAKGPGFEYWGKRPLSGHSPGKDTKKKTHRIERARAKRLTKKEKEEV